MKVILIQCIPYAVCAVFFLTVIIRTVISVKRIRIERKTDWIISGNEPSFPMTSVLAYRTSQRTPTPTKKDVDEIKVQHDELLKIILEQKKIYACRKMRLHKSSTGESTMYPDEKIQ